jgi:predicted permease
LIPLVAAFLPIWLLTAVGYLAARFGLLGPDSAQAENVLGRFVFRVAMPAALFGMLAKTDLHALANTGIIAFAASAVLTFAVGLTAARRLFRRPLGEQAISGMAAGYVNSANLGIPVAVQVLGSGSFVTTVILLQTVVITPAILTLVDVGNAAARPRLRQQLLLPLRNPIIVASALGASVSALHWHVPVDLAHSIALLGGAAVPSALIVLGMSLHGRTQKTDAADHRPRSGAETVVAVLLKTLFQPAVAYLVARYALHLAAPDLLAVVLCAALPTAQNVFIYAREYRLPVAVPRDTVIFSTLLSMATLWGVVSLLGT